MKELLFTSHALECETCPLRSQCTQSKLGRSISIHADESLLVELRERQITESGRAKLRERVSVEHKECSYWSMARRSCSLLWFTQESF